MEKKTSYLVRWKAKHMIFWRWTFATEDFVINRQVLGANLATKSEYMILMTRRGARKEIPYGDTVFLFSHNRQKLIQLKLKNEGAKI